MAVVCVCTLISVVRGNELEELLREAQESNPQVLAAKWKVEQALLSHEELAEFFDPTFFAGVGKSEKARAVPGGTNFTMLTNDSVDAQVGFEVPVTPGAYLSVGGANRMLLDPEGYDELYQTMYGVQLRVPLLKDRGFKGLSLKRALAMADYNANVSNLLKISQVMRRDIEIAYINAYEKLSSYRVTQEATRRFLALYEETQELSRLKVVPEYQIFESKMELQIGRDDEEKARANFELGLMDLAQKVGIDRRLALLGDQKALLDAGNMYTSLQIVSEEDACMARGAYLEIRNGIQYAQAQIDISEEETRDNLDFELGLTAQGEHETNPLGMEDILTDRRMGYEVAVIWRRNLDYRGPKTRIARYRARIKELNESLRLVRQQIRTEMLEAEMNFQAALKRLKLVREGIEAAKQNLASELERFRLGENTSADVTTAQKNLTTILQREVTASADLLRAHSNYIYAVGYYQPRPDDTAKKDK